MSQWFPFSHRSQRRHAWPGLVLLWFVVPCGADDAVERARALVAQGLYQEARDVLTAEAAPTVEAQALLGRVYFECGELEQAEPLLAAAAATDAAAARRLGIVQRRGRPQRIWPTSYEIDLLLSRVQRAFEAGDLAAGFDAADAILEGQANVLIARGSVTTPGSARAVRELFAALPPGTGEDYRRWLARRGEDPPAWNSEDLRRALARYPHPELAREWWARLADLDTAHGRPERAAAALRRAGQDGSGFSPAGTWAPETLRPASWFLPGPVLPALARDPGTVPFPEDAECMRNPAAPWVPVACSPDESLLYLSDGSRVQAVSSENGGVRFEYAGLPQTHDPRRAAFETRRLWHMRPPRLAEWTCRGDTLYGRLEYGDARGEVVALDARTGTLRWRSGDVEPLRGYAVCGGPLVEDGIVVLVLHANLRLSQYELCGLDARTGEWLWQTQVLAGDGTTRCVGLGDLDAGRSGPCLAGDGGRVYYVSHLGGVACVDLQLGTLEWVTRYTPLLRAGPRGAGPLPFFERWNSAPVAADSLVVVQPRDTNLLLVLTRESGEVANTIADLGLRSLIGVAAGHIVVTRNRREVAAYPAAATQAAWRWTAERDLVGRGALVDGKIVVRDGTQAVWLDAGSGAELRRAEIETLLEGLARKESLPAPIAHAARISADSNATFAPQWAMAGPVRRAQMLDHEGRQWLLVERAGRLECRDANDPAAVRWTVAAPLRAAGYAIRGNVLLRAEPDRLRGIDLASGGDAWTLAGRWRTPVASGAGWCAAERNLAIGAPGPDLGSSWRVDVPAPGEIAALAPAGDQVALLLLGPARLVLLDPATGGEVRSLTLLYPDGLAGRLSTDWETLNRAAPDTPFVDGERRLRWVEPEPWSMTAAGARIALLAREGACVVDFRTGAIDWWSWTPGRPPRRDAWCDVTPRGTVIVDHVSDPRALVLGADRVLTREVTLPVLVEDDAYLALEYSEEDTNAIAARSATDQHLLWRSAPLQQLASLGALALVEDRVVAVGKRLRTADLRLLACAQTMDAPVTDRDFPWSSHPADLFVPRAGVYVSHPTYLALYAAGAGPTLPPADAGLALCRAARRETAVAVVQVTGAIVLDGDASDWQDIEALALAAPDDWLPDDIVRRAGAASAPPDPEDFSAEVRLCADGELLCLCVVVRDDVHWPSPTARLAAGDCVEILLGRRRESETPEESLPLVHVRLSTSTGMPRLQRLPSMLTVDPQLAFDPWPWRPGLLGPVAAERATRLDRDAEQLVEERAAALQRVRCGLARDERSGITVYEIGVPLAWIEPQGEDERVEFQVTVHEADGPQERGALAWLAGGDGTVLRPAQLRLRGQAATKE